MTQDKVMLSTPQEIVISENIDNPDQYLDQIIENLSDDPEHLAAVDSIKSLGHNEKVRYLLGLRTGKEREAGDVSIMMEPVTG